jgi:hypothetical protein
MSCQSTLDSSREISDIARDARARVGSEQACLRTGKPVILRIPCEARECHVC